MTSKESQTTVKPFATYWESYGGWQAVLRSRYLRWSLAFAIVLVPAWWQAKWWAVTLQVLPNIVGFSIAGFAIWLAFGDEQFKSLLAEKDHDREVSDYMEISATFAHFVLVQILAIAFAVAGGALLEKDNPLSLAATWAANWPTEFALFQGAFGFVGFFLFAYAIGTAIAAVMAIFRVARLYAYFKEIELGLKKKGTAKGTPPQLGPAGAPPDERPRAQARRD